MSCPSKRMAPAVGLSCNRISFDVVVLPQPDSPITPSVSPAATVKSIPSTALTQPTLRRGKNAVLTAKCFVRPSISSNGGDMGIPGNILYRVVGLRLGEPAPRPPFTGDPHLA